MQRDPNCVIKSFISVLMLLYCLICQLDCKCNLDTCKLCKQALKYSRGVGWGGNPPDHIYIGFSKSVNATQFYSDRGGKNYSLRVCCAQLLGRACVAMWSRSLQKGICLELLQKVANILKYSFFRSEKAKTKSPLFLAPNKLEILLTN